MSIKSDKEFADELDARDRLKRRGFKMQTCKLCKGTGMFIAERDHYQSFLSCHACAGKGYIWEAPE